jgi:hypothetical protein
VPITVDLNGTPFDIPQDQEDSWGESTTNYLVAVATAFLKRSGGAFTLTADVNFGANFGLESIYFKSGVAAIISDEGILRLGNAESIGWRNQANLDNLLLTANTSNRLAFGPTATPVVIPTISSSDSLTNKTIVVTSNTITTTATGNLAAVELNAALAELQTDIDTRATATGLSDHLSDTVDAHDASAISNIPSGNLAATDVQAALNELQLDIDSKGTSISDHISDATDAHAGTAITNVPSGNLAATTVQAALNELQADVDTRATSASPTFTGNTTYSALTATTVPYLDGSKILTSSTVTPTELGYVSGVTSAIQTQLNAKAPIASPTFTGTVTIPTGGLITAPSFASYTDFAIISAQSAPGSGVRVYGKADGKLYKIDSVSGLESAIGGGLAPEAKTAGFTAVSGKHYLINTTSGAVAVQLPAGTSEAAIKFSDANETWDTYNVTITPASGETIDSLAVDEALVCDVKRGWVELSWNGARWVLGSLASTTVAEAGASTTGTVNTTTQTFAGLKTFNDGLKLDDAAGQSTLNYYREDDTTLASCTFQGNLGGSASAGITIKITRAGRKVTLDIPILTTVVPTTNSIALVSNTALPSWARPSGVRQGFHQGLNNGAWVSSEVGVFIVETTGIIYFYRNLASTAYTNSANAGWYHTQITYSV